MGITIFASLIMYLAGVLLVSMVLCFTEASYGYGESMYGESGYGESGKAFIIPGTEPRVTPGFYKQKYMQPVYIHSYIPAHHDQHTSPVQYVTVAPNSGYHHGSSLNSHDYTAALARQGYSVAPIVSHDNNVAPVVSLDNTASLDSQELGVAPVVVSHDIAAAVDSQEHSVAPVVVSHDIAAAVDSHGHTVAPVVVSHDLTAAVESHGHTVAPVVVSHDITAAVDNQGHSVAPVISYDSTAAHGSHGHGHTVAPVVSYGSTATHGHNVAPVINHDYSGVYQLVRSAPVKLTPSHEHGSSPSRHITYY